MNHSIIINRAPNGAPLDADAQGTLRALIAERGARRLVEPLGVSITALERAAAGGRVLRGTRALIRAGLETMHAAAPATEVR